jgi:hypothetical protein
MLIVAVVVVAVGLVASDFIELGQRPPHPPRRQG